MKIYAKKRVAVYQEHTNIVILLKQPQQYEGNPAGVTRRQFGMPAV